MVEVINQTASAFADAYSYILNTLPENMQILPPVIMVTIMVIIYSIFVWIFYRFVAKRDIIRLNLNKYNHFSYAWLIKLFVIIFYIIEFIVILPFVTSFWFAVFSILLIILAKEQPLSSILLISASIITAVRVTSYYKEDLSKDLAKMFPFTLLGVVILTPGFFDISTTISKMASVPGHVDTIIYYAFFIILIEIVLRLFYLVVSFAMSGGEEEVKEMQEEEKES